jgi:ubiquinone/menaquinone biosynthesis C-methylase UbiE
MLAIARRRLGARSQVRIEQLDAEEMPSVASDSIDTYSISLGLKICDRGRAFAEAIRVLRPGGRLIILESSNIPWEIAHRVYLGYMAFCLPVIGWMATGGDPSAYRYLLAGIQEFPSAEALVDELQAAGFKDVTFERLSLGIVAIHTGCKPAKDA